MSNQEILMKLKEFLEKDIVSQKWHIKYLQSIIGPTTSAQCLAIGSLEASERALEYILDMEGNL